MNLWKDSFLILLNFAVVIFVPFSSGVARVVVNDWEAILTPKVGLLSTNKKLSQIWETEKKTSVYSFERTQEQGTFFLMFKSPECQLIASVVIFISDVTWVTNQEVIGKWVIVRQAKHLSTPSSCFIKWVTERKYDTDSRRLVCQIENPTQSFITGKKVPYHYSPKEELRDTGGANVHLFQKQEKLSYNLSMFSDNKGWNWGWKGAFWSWFTVNECDSPVQPH